MNEPHSIGPDAYLPNGIDAYLHKTGVPGELVVFVRQPARGLKRAMLVTDPGEIQGAIMAMVEDIFAEHAQELGRAEFADKLSGNVEVRPS